MKGNKCGGLRFLERAVRWGAFQRSWLGME